MMQYSDSDFRWLRLWVRYLSYPVCLAAAQTIQNHPSPLPLPHPTYRNPPSHHSINNSIAQALRPSGSSVSSSRRACTSSAAAEYACCLAGTRAASGRRASPTESPVSVVRLWTTPDRLPLGRVRSTKQLRIRSHITTPCFHLIVFVSQYHGFFHDWWPSLTLVPRSAWPTTVVFSTTMDEPYTHDILFPWLSDYRVCCSDASLG